MFTSRTLVRTTIALVGLATLVAAARPRSASARLHTYLKKSEPAANDTLAAAPHSVRLWFSERVEIPVTTVKITDASGSALSLGALARPDTGEAAPIVAAIAGSVRAGTYTVAWSTAAKDGHPAQGKFAFVVKAAS